MITGASGFIGSNLTRGCLQKGHTVFAFCRFSSGLRDFAAFRGNHQLNIVKGDITDPTSFESLHDVDAVFHLAANTDLKKSFNNPLLDLETNVGGTINLLEWARKRDICLVYFSTGSVYGEPKYIPVDEDHPLFPTSPYAVSKLMAEKYCWLYSRQYGLNISILRIFHPYGPCQPISKAIPTFILRIFANRPVLIKGKGDETMAFIYVSDLVKAALTALEKGKKGEIYNVGGNEPTSMKEIVSKISYILQKDPIISFVKKDESRSPLLLPSIEKAKRDLGFVPEIGLGKGLTKTVDWYLRHLTGTRSIAGRKR